MALADSEVRRRCSPARGRAGRVRTTPTRPATGQGAERTRHLLPPIVDGQFSAATRRAPELRGVCQSACPQRGGSTSPGVDAPTQSRLEASGLASASITTPRALAHRVGSVVCSSARVPNPARATYGFATAAGASILSRRSKCSGDRPAPGRCGLPSRPRTRPRSRNDVQVVTRALRVSLLRRPPLLRAPARTRPRAERRGTGATRGESGLFRQCARSCSPNRAREVPGRSSPRRTRRR